MRTPRVTSTWSSNRPVRAPRPPRTPLRTPRAIRRSPAPPPAPATKPPQNKKGTPSRVPFSNFSSYYLLNSPLPWNLHIDVPLVQRHTTRYKTHLRCLGGHAVNISPNQ